MSPYLPCISDADPGEHDMDDDDGNPAILDAVRNAIEYLRNAEEELERKHPRNGVVDESITDALAALSEVGFPPLPVKD